MKLGKLGTGHQMYIPWMQATYFMVANKQALPYLPKGANLNALTYDQLAAWAPRSRPRPASGCWAFPPGRQGLMHRFIEGFLYPSYTGGLVTTFRAPGADAMWTQFAALWKDVNPNSTNYNFMQEPLLSGDVWIALRSRRAAARRAAPEAGRFRRVPGAGRSEGARLHAGARRPRDRQGCARCRRRQRH